MRRLAIVTTHPIQYNGPWFSLLSSRGIVTVKVFYTWSQSREGAKFDPDFGQKIQWDIPLLDGYDYTFVNNTAPDPGSHHFSGIRNPTLNKDLAAWQPDALLIFGWNFESHLRCLLHFGGKIPVLFRGDSTLLDEQPGIKRALRRVFLSWVYRRVDYALYTGTNNKAYFLKYGLKKDQLFLAPHAIDNRRFAFPDALYREKAEKWKTELGITPDDLVLLFAGKLEPKKNPSFLLELAKKESDRRLKILFVGNGLLEKELKQKARGDNRIIFIDFQNQSMMPIVYRLGDVLVLPSAGHGETWGLAANEAMACGCALMLSDKVGGAPDLIPDHRNGLVFKPSDVGSGLQFIRRLLLDRHLLREMQENSKQHVANFSFEQITRAVEGIANKI